MLSGPTLAFRGAERVLAAATMTIAGQGTITHPEQTGTYGDEDGRIDTRLRIQCDPMTVSPVVAHRGRQDVAEVEVWVAASDGLQHVFWNRASTSAGRQGQWQRWRRGSER